MKTVLAAINAKYIHSNPAIRSIGGYAASRGLSGIVRKEYTINQQPEFILSDLFLQKPDVLGLSCYLWNYEIVCRLVPELQKLLPGCTVFVGGPEVTYDPGRALEETGADIVVYGEGEESCYQLLSAIEQGRPVTSLRGIAFYGTDGSTVVTPPQEVLEMDRLPFIYDIEDGMEETEHRILYFESTRGCPFQCRYCLSGESGNVRFLSLPRVFHALDFFLSRRVRQVKFVDRTFNCDRNYAMEIWQYLIAHDNGVTNFHFEIAAELLDSEMIRTLRAARPGFFQFEIGVQSTNPETLKAVNRPHNWGKLSESVRALKAAGNIHLHLDLIAGLPYEGIDSFHKSFCDVFSLCPDQLQLGFLKLLKGSLLRRDCEKYGIVFRDTAPYEVLFTNAVSFEEMLILKRVEHMVELYYNSGRHTQSMQFLSRYFPDAFSLYKALGTFFADHGYHTRSLSMVEHHTVLYRFLDTLESDPQRHEEFQWMVKYDLYTHEKARRLPQWLTVSRSDEYRSRINRYFSDPQMIAHDLPEYAGMEPKQVGRTAHIEVFPFHPVTGQAGDIAVLFNYRRRERSGNASCKTITLPSEE